MSEDGFNQMIDDSRAFFAELKQNNSKDWFNPRKDHYNARIKKPAELFADLLAEDFSGLAGIAHKPKVFRIYRDVRFSKDKTPLNTHLHIMWTAGDARFSPAFFFASEVDGLHVGCGIMGLKGDDLLRYRAFIDSWGDLYGEAVAATGMTPSDWGEAALKRVPAPYGQDHPHAELLKQKKIVLGKPLGEGWRDAGIYSAVKQAFKDAAPLRDLLAEKLG